MIKTPTSTSTPTDFLANAERLVTPVYTEPFTDETRNVRNLLLATSFVLILFVFGVVTLGNANPSLLPVDITVKTGMRWILIALCAYFLMLLVARSAIEWKLWRLRHQAPMMVLGNLSSTITNSWLASTNQANAKLASSLETFWRQTEKANVVNTGAGACLADGVGNNCSGTIVSRTDFVSVDVIVTMLPEGEARRSSLYRQLN